MSVFELCSLKFLDLKKKTLLKMILHHFRNSDTHLKKAEVPFAYLKTNLMNNKIVSRTGKYCTHQIRKN